MSIVRVGTVSGTTVTVLLTIARGMEPVPIAAKATVIDMITSVIRPRKHAAPAVAEVRKVATKYCWSYY